MIPWILGLAFIGVLIFLAWTFLKKQGKAFQKDYSKEAYKEKIRFYSRNPPRISSSKWGWSLLIFTFILLGTLLVCVFLFGAGILPKFPVFWAVLIPILGAVVLLVFNLSNPFIWMSYPRAVNSRGELLGFMLSVPAETPDGYLETMVFKKTRWLIMKQVDILSIPIADSFNFPLKNKKTGETKEKVFKISIPREERYRILGNGDLLVNCPSYFATKYHIYPNFTDSTKTFDLRDIIFLKEKKDGDLLNFTDMANEYRENSVILAGGNPHNRIEGSGASPRKDNFEGE